MVIVIIEDIIQYLFCEPEGSCCSIPALTDSVPHVVLQLLDFLDYHPVAFISLIQQSLEFAVSCLFTHVGEGVTFERFTVQCMNLIKMILQNHTYKPAKNIEGEERCTGVQRSDGGVVC